MFGQSILILVPHPDDEVVGPLIAGQRAIQQGSSIHLLYLTNGVPARETLWPWHRHRHGERVATRWDEAETVAKLAGFAIAARQDIPTRTLRSHMKQTESLMTEALRSTGADTLWCPAWEGGHQDHDVANALASRQRSVQVYEFAEYNNAGGSPRLNRFPKDTGKEIVLTLTEEEQAFKKRCLGLYASEKANLSLAGTGLETFRPLPVHDYAALPHEGTLFHARFRRFGWHPRVDETDPLDVRADLASYLGLEASDGH
ncbi:MAG: PIG-L deacetylase family protein [Magnetovibrionaceae bacterium]